MGWDHVWQIFTWPFTALIGIVSFFLIFREQIQKLLPEITWIEIDPRNRKFKARFGRQIELAKARAKGVRKKVTASRSLPAANPVIDPAKQTARDVVLEAWGALKQIVYDACTASKIPLTPVTRIPEAVRRLADANLINADLVHLVDVLYELGQELADDTSLRPTGNDAVAYKKLTNDIVDWMMLSVLSPGKREEPERQPTVVDSNFPQPRGSGEFPQPRPGHPTALLVGISGPVQGRRFSIEKEQYRLGRNADNDLCITGDDYVSSHHASLLYEKGSLFLSDQGSRNGTFLNEKKVAETTMVQWGDRIRLGGSIFQVSETPT